jgi:hypothetical protein
MLLSGSPALGVLGGVRDIADKAEPVTGADHFGAELGETMMGDGTRLEIADVVRRVMDQLHVPDATSAGLSWPLPGEMTDSALETALFAAAGTKQGHRRQLRGRCGRHQH